MAMMDPGMTDGVDPEWLHQVYTGGKEDPGRLCIGCLDVMRKR